MPGPDPVCEVHGLACAELWGELEDGRVDQIREEAAFDVGLDDNDGFYWSDPPTDEPDGRVRVIKPWPCCLRAG